MRITLLTAARHEAGPVLEKTKREKKCEAAAAAEAAAVAAAA